MLLNLGHGHELAPTAITQFFFNVNKIITFKMYVYGNVRYYIIIWQFNIIRFQKSLITSTISIRVNCTIIDLTYLPNL